MPPICLLLLLFRYIPNILEKRKLREKTKHHNLLTLTLSQENDAFDNVSTQPPDHSAC